MGGDTVKAKEMALIASTKEQGIESVTVNEHPRLIPSRLQNKSKKEHNSISFLAFLASFL
jgi:hypothetical protein